MRIEAMRERQFNPITVTLTIEMIQEYQTLISMCALEGVIAPAVAGEACHSEAEQVVRCFLRDLRHALQALRP